jgi:hypothetical protein
MALDCHETKLIARSSKIVSKTRHVKQSYVCIVPQDKLIIKIFWTLGLLTASAVCCCFVVYALAKYLSYEIDYETTSLFPKVTFCDVNTYTTKRSYQLTNDTTFHEVFIHRVNYSFNTTQRDTLSHSLDDILFERVFVQYGNV